MRSCVLPQMITPPVDYCFCTFSDSFTREASSMGRSLQYHKQINTLMQQYSSTSSGLWHHCWVMVVSCDITYCIVYWLHRSDVIPGKLLQWKWESAYSPFLCLPPLPYTHASHTTHITYTHIMHTHITRHTHTHTHTHTSPTHHSQVSSLQHSHPSPETCH